MFETMQPLHDKVLVKILKQDEKTSGGIYIPDEVERKHLKGCVIATGTGRFNDKGTVNPLTVKPGDTVTFGKYSGVELDDVYRVLREEEIYGII